MPEAIVHIGNGGPPIQVRINGTQPTFHLGSDRISAQMLKPIDPRLEDLLEIAATVFAADSTVTRGGAARSHLGADWRRRFDFDIPVREPDFWSRSNVTDALADAVGFLTEDAVSFRFHARSSDAPGQQYLDLDPGGAAFSADEVILFSGGLDSFAGALETLATSDKRVALVTHRSAQKAIPRQVALGKYLAERFPRRVLHVQVRATRAGAEGREKTQRSRSFLFAALGQVIARMLGATQVNFFENGIISHNLPISPQVIGSMATRTTHPLAIAKLNALMNLVGPEPVPIRNRYEWITKTEVVARVAEHGGAESIRQTVSCTSVRDQSIIHTHCGACTQCFDRRFAILANGLADQDPEIHYQTDVFLGKRHTDRSRTMAVEWSRHSLRLRDLDLRTFVTIFGQDLARICRGYESQPSADILQLTIDMHRRHSESVLGVLKEVIKNNAEAIATGALAETSFLALHLGGRKELPPDPRPALRIPRHLGPVAESELILDPAAPLEVAFFHEADVPVVAVVGLARITGLPAAIPHGLKPTFDQDCSNGVSHESHHYIHAGDIPGAAHMSKDAIRKNVARCRKTLAVAFREIHGEDPSRHLLIENKQAHGYRLEPGLKLTTRDRVEQG